jgi:hypothetical protein
VTESMGDSAQLIETAKDVEVVRTLRNIVGGSVIGVSYELIRGISGNESYYEEKLNG